VQRYEKLF